MEGAAVGAPPVVVRLVETIESVAAGVDLNLGITDQGAYVVVIHNVVQCALMNAKAQANRFLAKPENKDLAQTLDIAGSIPTARWPDATLAQPTCGVQYIKKVLDWAAERHGGVQVLSVDERSALVNTVRARLLPHAGQLLRKLRLQLAESFGSDTAHVDQELGEALANGSIGAEIATVVPVRACECMPHPDAKSRVLHATSRWQWIYG